MIQKKTIDIISKQDWLGKTADIIQPALVNVYKAGEEQDRKLKTLYIEPDLAIHCILQ